MALPPLSELLCASPEAIQSLLAEVTTQSWFTGCFHQIPASSPVPVEFGGVSDLRSAGVIGADRVPRFRINRIREKVFLTDLPEMARSGGVYAFTDEAESLLEAAVEYEPGIAGDVSTGCGHTMVCVSASARVAVDRSSRAVDFARMNASINSVEMAVNVAEVGRDFPPESWNALWQSGNLLLANLPFVIAPPRVVLPRVSDGGNTGLEAIASLLKSLSLRTGAGTDIVVLVYTLGGADTGWAIEQLMHASLPGLPYRFELLDGARLWRVNGIKIFTNPMDISDLTAKADCRLTFTDDQRGFVRESYKRLAQSLRASGWEQLGYGVLKFRI